MTDQVPAEAPSRVVPRILGVVVCCYALLGLVLSVAGGARRPLLEPAREARHVHGDDGMGDLGLPPSTRAADPRHAVELLHAVLTGAAERGGRLSPLVRQD